MERSQIWKRLNAGLLLAVFMLSATPKKTLHDLFAHHKDITSSSAFGNVPSYIQSGFRCHCENLVVESPFVVVVQDLNAKPQVFHEQKEESGAVRCLVAAYYNAVLRGPPASANA